jgi:peptidoglycan/xylan/chitin deacetylase (PgdA/CDA1 family)
VPIHLPREPLSPDREINWLSLTLRIGWPELAALDANSRQYTADVGYAVVLWNIDPKDWRRPGAKVIADHVVREACPGAIVLMHEGGGDRAESVAALETILRQLSQQGYVFRNVYLP